jgi:hypothetical protein
MQLVPVEHDPFSGDPVGGHLTSIHTELAGTAKKLSELVAHIEHFGEEARRLDALFGIEIRKIAEVVDAGAGHFDEKLDALRADLAKAMKHTDTGPHVAKLEAAIAKVTKMVTDLRSVAPAAPVPVEIERDKTGKPIRVKKGDQTFSIERRDGNVVGMVLEGPEDKTPKTPRSAKRFAN